MTEDLRLRHRQNNFLLNSPVPVVLEGMSLEQSRQEAERSVLRLTNLGMRAFRRGNADSFMALLDNTVCLPFVCRWWREFQQRGILERALVYALTSSRLNNFSMEPATLERLLAVECDRKKLMAGGTKLPGGGPFTVYRGVSGHSAQRRIRGLSWTGSLDVACWFAMRYAETLPDPGVYKATVGRNEIFFFTDDRKECEFVCRPKRYQRVDLAMDEMGMRALWRDET